MENLYVFFEINVFRTRVADTNNGIKPSISCILRKSLLSAVQSARCTRDVDMRIRLWEYNGLSALFKFVVSDIRKVKAYILSQTISQGNWNWLQEL